MALLGFLIPIPSSHSHKQLVYLEPRGPSLELIYECSLLGSIMIYTMQIIDSGEIMSHSSYSVVLNDR